MGHKIIQNVSSKRSDLAIEFLEQDNENIKMQVKEIDNTKITTVDILKDGIISKKKGHYVTIEYSDITDYEEKEKVKKIFAKQMKEFLKYLNIKEENSCLIVGLGNRKSLPDSLGNEVVDKVIVTNHLFMVDEVEDGFRKTYAITPGVTGETGMETQVLIRGIVKAIQPSFVIIIDSLLSLSVDRLLKTIQISDAGIAPGSGVGNHRQELSLETLGIPVISVGVPTVVDMTTIVSDTIGYLYQYFSFRKEHYDNKLILGGIKENDLSKIEKRKILGEIGSLEEEEVKGLIYEVLSLLKCNLIVMPKDTDFIIEHVSDIIGNGLNRALHKKINEL